MRHPFPAILALAALIVSAPGCDDSVSPETYADSVTVGSGRTGIALTEIRTAFAESPVTIYWRAESAEEFGGKDIYLEVTPLESSGWSAVPVYSTVQENANSTSHIAIAAYYHTYGNGTFRARGYLGAARRLLGTAEFTVGAE